MSVPDWRILRPLQPNARNFVFDLERVLDSMVAVSARIPEDAFTAETLGTERAGNGVVIDDRERFLTIGYLITEAEEVWLRANDGRLFPARCLATIRKPASG